MAGLFFWESNSDYNQSNVRQKFLALGYKNPKYLHSGNWHILVFPKLSYDIDNWLEIDGRQICGVGTFAYKGLVYEKALSKLLNDFIKNKLDKKSFWGSFLILINSKEGLTLLRDGACLTRLFSIENNKVFSTSFAGLIDTSPKPLNINRDAVIELFSSGLNTADNTIIQEIKSLIPPFYPQNIDIWHSECKEYPEPLSRTEALHQQINIAQDYYNQISNDWKNYQPSGVLDIGVTGGMDSRLSVALASKCDIEKVFHTSWRKEGMKNSDFRYATILAKETNTKLNTQKITPALDMNEEQLIQTYENAYELSDGNIRQGVYWDEANNTTNYRQKLTQPPYLRLMGYGGEQYRNDERLPLKSNRNLRSWIKWEMTYHIFGNNFISKSEENRIFDIIERNIINQIGPNLFLNLQNHKEYIHLIQSTSYRSIKANYENRIGFCINPFLDTCLSKPAFMAIPYLGKSLGFQIEMIKNISCEIAKIPNGYGFNFAKGEPFLQKTGSVIWQLLPPYLKIPLYRKLVNSMRSDYVSKMTEKFPFVNKLEQNVKELNLPIKHEEFRQISQRARLILNLGYFIERNREKINF